MAVVVVATEFGGPDALSVFEEPVPAPDPGQATVRVRAIGVNQIDRSLYSGAYGTDPALLPVRVGGEFAGVVTAVGQDAVGRGGLLRVGEEVVGYETSGVFPAGAYASEVTVSADTLRPKPAGLAWEKAAGVLLTGSTAVHALDAVEATAGDTLLVHGGAGGVGYNVGQLAVLRGARVIGTAAPAQHERLRAHGIEPVTYGEGLADRVRALAPDGVDAAIDTVGTEESVGVSVAVVGKRERIVAITGYGPATAAGVTLIGGFPGADPGTEVRANAWRELLPMAAAGDLDVVIARTFPLSQAAAAHEFLATGHPQGKIILIP